MDKEKMEQMLSDILEKQLKVAMGGTEFTEMINTEIKTALEGMQGKLTGDPQIGGSLKRTSMELVRSALPYHRVDGNMLVTRQGSILDMNKKSAPWVQLSPEVEGWFKEFAGYTKAGGLDGAARIGKLLQESSDPSGGYLVPEEFKATMLMYDTEPAVIWPRATVWPMGSDKLGMPKLGQDPGKLEDDDSDFFAGVDFTWTDEGGTKAETEPNFEFIELIAHELSGYTPVTNQLLDDSVINLVNFLTILFRAAWIWHTDKKFIRGSGANQPLGIVTDPQIYTQPRQTANTVTFTDLNNMWTLLPAVFEAGAIWLMNKQVIADIRDERDTNNALLLQEQYSALAEGYQQTIFGVPVVKADYKTYPMGTKGDVILCNPRYYYIGDRQNFTMDASRHYLFRSNKTAFRVTGRLDGQPAVSEAFVVLDDVAAAS